MTVDEIEQFHNDCLDIMRNCPNAYAKAYASAGRLMFDDKAIRVQCLYILNNLQHWRKGRATEIRANLKRLGNAK